MGGGVGGGGSWLGELLVGHNSTHTTTHTHTYTHTHTQLQVTKQRSLFTRQNSRTHVSMHAHDTQDNLARKIDTKG